MRAPTCHLPRVLLICLKRAGPSSRGFSSLVTSSRRYSAGVNTSLAHSQNTSVLCQRKEKLKPKCLVKSSCLAVNAFKRKCWWYTPQQCKQNGKETTGIQEENNGHFHEHFVVITQNVRGYWSNLMVCPQQQWSRLFLATTDNGLDFLDNNGKNYSGQQTV